MKTIKIKGKDYVEVKERVKDFHDKYPNGSISTELLHHSDGLWVVKATIVTDVDKPRVFTGLAQEVESEDYKQVNFSSALENAETSAVGRAMAFLNIGVVDSIASVDEINKANNRKYTKPKFVSDNGGFNPKIHEKIERGFVESDVFLEEVKKYEAHGGGYDGKAKAWYLPKDKAEQLKNKINQK